jgi:hypothetical protein
MKMKNRWAVILVILGCIGILQYCYFQLFTSLAIHNIYNVIPDPTYGKWGLMDVEVTVIRDWGVGIIPAIAGAFLILIGGIRLKKRDKWLVKG